MRFCNLTWTIKYKNYVSSVDGHSYHERQTIHSDQIACLVDHIFHFDSTYVEIAHNKEIFQNMKEANVTVYLNALAKKKKKFTLIRKKQM